MCLCSTSLVISELTRSRPVRDGEGREVVAVMTVMGRLGAGGGGGDEGMEGGTCTRLCLPYDVPPSHRPCVGCSL